MGGIPRHSRPSVERIFRALQRDLQRLLPGVHVEHVGGTSVPGLLTKGDLDVQVRVDAENFASYSRILSDLYEPNKGGFWCKDGRSFKHQEGPIPIGLHLTVIGGSCDVQWKHRDALLQSPTLRRELNALKARTRDWSEEQYYQVKDVFFSKIAAVD